MRSSQFTPLQASDRVYKKKFSTGDRKYLPFHKNHRNLLFLSAFGGIYHPAINKIFKSPASHWCLWTYTSITLFFLAAMPVLTTVHLLFFTKSLQQAIMNLMVISSGLHCSARIIWFLYRRDRFGRLYEMWDDYFGQDKDVVSRKVSRGQVDFYFYIIRV